jgi:hypothetical protein
MKYHRLHIHTDGTQETYDALTTLLHLQPMPLEINDRSQDPYGVWTYGVDTNEDDPYFDFIHVFLDALDPVMDQLQQLGIEKEAITFWLIYEYDQQCAMEFHPSEMARIGSSGIVLCIDCLQKNL